MAELKAVMSKSNLRHQYLTKRVDVDCVDIDPLPPVNKGARPCELVVDNIDNIVAFATFRLNSDFEVVVVRRLGEGNPYRVFFMPHNHDYHWGSPKQPGFTECGNVVMRYMMNIIFVDDMYAFASKWLLKTRTSYKIGLLDEVRQKVLKHIKKLM
ncbi:hypothetical protein POM88_029048 [Heracleum sosnowskyi]|uniref:Uncharacterized protein n=1 Tax=Heracleum sosnowskyi TaxID=360622 RepID=A0AAD8MEI7_9APIA|nr:hypothetical protein POM88_029048 [Heracleum sosnowskyi]